MNTAVTFADRPASLDTNPPSLIQAEGGFKHSFPPSDDGVGQGRLSDSEKRRAIDRAAAAVERAFLEWHRSGCMASAAEYTRARNVWCEMLMKWGAV